MTLKAEYTITHEDKKLVDYTLKYCERRKTTLDRLRNATHEVEIRIKNGLIVGLRRKFYSDIWTIARITKDDPGYVERVLKEMRKPDFPIRTTNYERL